MKVRGESHCETFAELHHDDRIRYVIFLVVSFSARLQADTWVQARELKMELANKQKEKVTLLSGTTLAGHALV